MRHQGPIPIGWSSTPYDASLFRTSMMNVSPNGHRMNDDTKKLYRSGIIGGMFILALFLWLGSVRIVDMKKESSIRGYGGTLPDKVVTALARMNRDLENAKAIVYARPDRVCFIDASKTLKEYSFAYAALWCDDTPVISGIQAFHFEYRDDRGNLFARAGKYLPSVETVAYTIRISENDRDVLTNCRVKIPSNRTFHRLNNRSLAAWIDCR
ncbi:MAG: hypothetical protein ABIL68_14965 [bacterium]